MVAGFPLRKSINLLVSLETAATCGETPRTRGEKHRLNQNFGEALRQEDQKVWRHPQKRGSGSTSLSPGHFFSPGLRTGHGQANDAHPKRHRLLHAAAVEGLPRSLVAFARARARKSVSARGKTGGGEVGRARLCFLQILESASCTFRSPRSASEFTVTKDLPNDPHVVAWRGGCLLTPRLDKTRGS